MALVKKSQLADHDVALHLSADEARWVLAILGEVYPGYSPDYHRGPYRALNAWRKEGTVAGLKIAVISASVRQAAADKGIRLTPGDLDMRLIDGQ